jgi:23S rRNA (uridine2552-2'-O)-methyltransferase
MAKSKSSGRWLNEHFQDEYVKKAQEQCFRSRAVFKLLEIQEKDRILKPGMQVVDLGAAPGGWSQYAQQKVGKKGAVVALDILEMEPLQDVIFIQGDFREQSVFDQLNEVLAGKPVDLVISDMAPNMSGNRAVDQAGAMYLAELAFETALTVLKSGGDFLVKVFQGEGCDQLQKEMRKQFKEVKTRKPKASRARSREVYLLARGRQL